ncbi:MAG: DUF1566 domain-containing protein [Desulfobacteraceae bacterium]|nr:DUF1566 domain-containing protein [Desulfobacteraceae bacterium]
MAAGELAFFGIKAKVAAKWVSTLYKKLVKIQKKSEKELDEINDLMFGDPMELANYYVEPDCQDVNPADHPDENFLISRAPVMKIVNEFLEDKSQAHGRNQLFVLSDAGMGKTALLTMLKLMHMTSFWPKKYDCVLKKLGKKTIPDIKKLTNKAGTILLLDSLDEDPAAYGKAEDRLGDILEESKNFFKVIITCRTQFFPKTETDPFKRQGMLKIGGYVCPAKYLSFFDDHKVIEYCERRFPKKWGLWTDQEKIDEARRVVKTMGMLRCRPMLLAYIEELMASPLLKEGGSEYQVYSILVQSWLDREQAKMDIPANDIMDACVMLAVYMNIRQVRSISGEHLENLVSAISKKLKAITELDIKGRSLLNRNSEGDYRFSHFSVQEFCVAKWLTQGEPVFKPPEGQIHMTDFIARMLYLSERKPELIDLIESDSLKSRAIEHISLRSKPLELSDDDMKVVRWRKDTFFQRPGSFTDNRDGTVTDSATGLMWQKSGSDNTMKHSEAHVYIDGLNRKKFAGCNDWRLPTLEELVSLLEDKKVNGFYINPVFECREYGWYWTADKRASGGAWLVYFNYGYVDWYNLDYNYYVRGVRSRTM